MIEVIRNGTAYSLDDGTYCHYLGADGWGAPPLWRITSRAAEQHGETDHGYRLRPRLGSLKLGIPGTSRSDLYARRAQLLGLFSPTGSISLRWTIGSSVKQIDLNLARDLTLSSAGQHGFYLEVGITLTCPDPTFYDPVMGSVDFGLGGGSGSFTVPMPVPHGVGASSLNETVGVNYPGSWFAYPVIRIEGPITSPVITNLTTDEKLDFTGTTIASSDYYDIDCNFGAKTVLDKNGNNKIDDLTNDSDLASFHLEPSPDQIAHPTWSNSIQVAGSSVTDATVVHFKYYMRYIGL